MSLIYTETKKNAWEILLETNFLKSHLLFFPEKNIVHGLIKQTQF